MQDSKVIMVDGEEMVQLLDEQGEVWWKGHRFCQGGCGQDQLTYGPCTNGGCYPSPPDPWEPSEEEVVDYTQLEQDSNNPRVARGEKKGGDTMERSFHTYQHLTPGVTVSGNKVTAMRGCDGVLHAVNYTVVYPPYDADGAPNFAEDLTTIISGLCDGVECSQECCGDGNSGCGFIRDISDDVIKNLQ